jgi:hypothetical protein
VPVRRSASFGSVRIRAQFPELAEAAAREQMSYRAFLAELLMAECDDRACRRSERGIKAAGFPREKSLRTLDLEANPSVDPAVIHTLATCDWVKKGLPLCLIGGSGTGKSHLLIALGLEAAMAGFRVRSTLAAKLVSELAEAADDRQLTMTIARYGRVDLLCPRRTGLSASPYTLPALIAALDEAITTLTAAIRDAGTHNGQPRGNNPPFRPAPACPDHNCQAMLTTR